MEARNGLADDDLGSGWLEVKKKRRSTGSKLSLQGWVSESSGKQSSQGSESSQLKGGNFQVTHGPNVQKPKVSSSLRSQGTLADATRGEKEGADVLCLSYAKDTNSHLLLSKETVCTYQGVRSGEVPQKLKCDAAHRIKWGDLNDKLILQYGRKVESDNRPCVDDQVGLVAPVTPRINKQLVADYISGTLVENAFGGSAELLSHNNSFIEPLEIKMNVASEDANASPLPLAFKDEPSKETVQEMKEVFSVVTKDSLGPQEFNQSNDELHRKQNQPKIVEPVNGNMVVLGCSSVEVLEIVQASKSGNYEVSTPFMLYENHAENDSSQESKLSGECSGPDIHKEPRATFFF